MTEIDVTSLGENPVYVVKEEYQVPEWAFIGHAAITIAFAVAGLIGFITVPWAIIGIVGNTGIAYISAGLAARQ